MYCHCLPCVRLLSVYLLLATSLRLVTADEGQVVLSLSPQQVSARANEFRLLPADPELKDGNAAVVMLRIIWNQQKFIQKVVPEIPELLKLPHDDPRVKQFKFGYFERPLRRAAFMRNADWMYPLDEQPLAGILLPDVQGMRTFAGRGQSVWINRQIAVSDFPAAMDGILVQVACARHIARTPLVITQLVATTFATMALDRCELLISQPECPNLYWALAMLPDSLGDNQATIQWQAVMLERSLPSLQPRIPDYGDSDAWTKVAQEFSDVMLQGPMEPMSRPEGAALKARMLQEATSYLRTEQHLGQEVLDSMGSEATVMRWILAVNDSVHGRTEAAHSLPPRFALQRLVALETEIKSIEDRVKAPGSPFFFQPVSTYLALHRFDRRVKLLQTVESIRDYAARNGNQLPKSLDDLELPAPQDPLTERSFEYDVANGTAILRVPLIDGVPAEVQRQRTYEITLATSERAGDALE